MSSLFKIPLIDRYVMRQVIMPLVIAMAIGLMVLLSERLVRLLDVTLGKKNSFAVIFELLGYLVPHYLGLALPAALFLGLLFGFNRMSKDSELDAFMACGAGLHRLARPVIGLALVLSVCSLVIFGWLQPHTRYAYRAVLYSVKNVEVFYLAEEGVFMQAGTRTFILDKLERGSNSFERIFLFDYRGPAGAETVTSQSGSLIELPSDPRPVLRLEDGHRLRLDGWPRLHNGEQLPVSTSGTFQRVDTPLGKISGTIFRPRGIDERELTMGELLASFSKPREGIDRLLISTEFHKRLVSVATILILPFLALPFALGTRRGQRAYRFAVALAILVAFHEVIEQGAVFSKISGTSPFLTMWLPFLVLATFSLWRFANASFWLRRDHMQPVYDRMADIAARVQTFFLKRIGVST